MIKLGPILLALLLSADAHAESAVSSADLALSFSPEVANVDPGTSAPVTLTLTNDGYTFSPIDVTVAVTVPDGVELVATTAPVGTSYNEITDIWQISDLEDYGTVELVLELRPAATGYSVITAEVASSPVEDPDSWPADGEVCDDDYARMLLAAGNPDAGVPEAPDCTPSSPPDAGPVPDANTAWCDGGVTSDADPHPGYDEGDGGCAVGGHSSPGYMVLMIGLFLVALRRRSRQLRQV